MVIHCFLKRSKGVCAAWIANAIGQPEGEGCQALAMICMTRRRSPSLSAMTPLLSCRDSGRRARQTTDRWRAAVINRRDRTVLERPFGDLVLAGEPDSGLRLRIGQEPVEHTHPVGMTRNAVMQRDDHHPALCRAFLVELVELVLQRLLVGGGVVPFEGEGHDIVHVERVGHSDEIAALKLDDERFVHARLVDVVLEAEALQNVERVWGVPHPVSVPTALSRRGGLAVLWSPGSQRD